MLFSSRLLAGSMALMIGIPSVMAKFPSDFVVNGQPTSAAVQTRTHTTTHPVVSDDSESVFFPSDIPNGPITRGQFIDAIGSRLYDTDAQGTCFADLVSKPEADYTLLFNDMYITQPLAISVCVMMHNGLVRGSSNMLHPNQYMPAAEAAAVFSRLSTAIRNPQGREPWYQRYMETMHKIDPKFNLKPDDILTGAELRDMICVLKHKTPQLDPMGEFTGC